MTSDAMLVAPVTARLGEKPRDIKCLTQPLLRLRWIASISHPFLSHFCFCCCNRHLILPSWCSTVACPTIDWGKPMLDTPLYESTQTLLPKNHRHTHVRILPYQMQLPQWHHIGVNRTRWVPKSRLRFTIEEIKLFCFKGRFPMTSSSWCRDK